MTRSTTVYTEFVQNKLEPRGLLRHYGNHTHPKINPVDRLFRCVSSSEEQPRLERVPQDHGAEIDVAKFSAPCFCKGASSAMARSELHTYVLL